MAYGRVNWENLPSTKTPVNADNLNKMDEGIANAVNAEIKTEGLSFINPEKFNEGNLQSVKVGRLVFIIGNFVPNTQVVGNIINLKYKPIHPDEFWGVLHVSGSEANSHCYVNGYENTPRLSTNTTIKANVKYWIDIKYITNE